MIRRIIGGEFPPGSALPPEGMLAEQFGVSRNPIRESMKVLAKKGVISIQHGRGSIVQPPERWDPLDPGILTAQLERPDTAWSLLAELSRARIALESEMARAAAERITPEEIERMRSHVARMGEAGDNPEAYLELDFRFHDLVMEASGNKIAHAIMSSISGPLRQSRRITNQIAGGVENAHQFHVHIFERIADHDAYGAEKVMREHLEWSLEHLREQQAVLDSRADAQSETAGLGEVPDVRKDLRQRPGAGRADGRPRGHRGITPGVPIGKTMATEG